MMTRILIAPITLAAATFALGALAVPASAEAGKSAARTESTESGSGAPAKAEARPSKVRYCFVDEITGSHIPQKICRTKEQWKALGVEVPVQ